MNFKLLFAKSSNEYFLILLPAYFVFHGYAEYYFSVLLTDILRIAIEYFFTTFVLYVIFVLIFKSRRKASLYVFALMAFHFFFGAMHDTVKSILYNTFLTKYTFILPFTLVLFTALFILLFKSKRSFNKIVRFFNCLLIIFILIDIPRLVKDISKANEKAILNRTFSICDSCPKPDIYLIVADEYAGWQELSDVFRFDNSPFEHFLESKGFHIIRNSKSNYNFTPFSLSSMLSMNFLSNLEGSNSSNHDMNITYRLINKNNLWNFFKSNGYEIKNYSIFNVDDVATKAPQDVLTVGSKSITSQTFLSRIDMDIRFNLVSRFKIRSEMERVAEYTKNSNEILLKKLLQESNHPSEKPRFIYTHLLMPHSPYYYDSVGKSNPIDSLNKGHESNKEYYISYLKYCNKRFTDLITSVINNIKSPSIIIFMGDHGWRFFKEEVNHRYFFMNLCSIYLPDKNYAPYYNGMSNVNLFRILLNNQFNQKLPLLKDSSSFLKN